MTQTMRVGQTGKFRGMDGRWHPIVLVSGPSRLGIREIYVARYADGDAEVMVGQVCIERGTLRLDD